MICFLTGMTASGWAAAKISKNPGFVAIMSIFGVCAAAVGLSEPIEEMIDSYVKKFPNGNEIVKERCLRIT